MNKIYFYIAHQIGVLATIRAVAFLNRLVNTAVIDYKHIENVKSGEPCALYIHMPFCHEPLCAFCCFIRYPYDKKLNALYIDALKKELEWIITTVGNFRRPSVYFGGGTPTIDMAGLAEVIDLIRSYLGSVNITVEANPRDVNNDAVKILRELNVTRLSIGVQSLNRKRLTTLGRLNHTLDDVFRAVEAAKGRFKTVNIDILWGAPGDDVDTVRSEAKNALSLGLDQVTFYPLMPPAPPRLSRNISEGGPWHPEEPALYMAILVEALAHNYHPATPWCMERGAGIIDEYVVECVDFLAAGISGIGRLNGYVYLNTFDVTKYIKLVGRRGFSAVRSIKASNMENALYYALSRLFGRIFSPKDLWKFGVSGVLLSTVLNVVLSVIGERKDEYYELKTPGALYLLHAAQKGVYMAVNALRRKGLRYQI